jgi:hypothetical protein
MLTSRRQHFEYLADLLWVMAESSKLLGHDAVRALQVPCLKRVGLG